MDVPKKDFINAKLVVTQPQTRLIWKPMLNPNIILQAMPVKNVEKSLIYTRHVISIKKLVMLPSSTGNNKYIIMPTLWFEYSFIFIVVFKVFFPTTRIRKWRIFLDVHLMDCIYAKYAAKPKNSIPIWKIILNIIIILLVIVVLYVEKLGKLKGMFENILLHVPKSIKKIYNKFGST